MVTRNIIICSCICDPCIHVRGFLYILKKMISHLTPEYLSELSSSGLLIVKFLCMGISFHLHYVDRVQSILNVNHILLRHEESRHCFTNMNSEQH